MRELLLAGLVSPEADQLYGRLVAAGSLRIGRGPGEIDMDSTEARELAESNVLYGNPSRPDQVQALSAPVAIQLLLSRHQQAIMAAHDVVKEGWTALESLLRASQIESSGQDAPDAMIELVTDRTRLNALSVELYVSARAELCTTNTGHFARPLGEHQAITPPKASLANGARFRGIYDASYGATPAGAKILELSRQAGEEIRIRPLLPAKTLLVDGIIGMVALTETGVGGAALIRSPQLLALLKQWFEMVWDDPGTTAGAPLTKDPLTRAQRHVLGLLAAGATDDAIARASGMSVRTVRRHITSVMESLGTQTRFATGVAAAKRGWI